MAFAGCGSTSHVPDAATQPVATALRPKAGAPQFSGGPPARMVLETRALDVDPGGFARFLVRVRFLDANGNATGLVRGGNVDFYPSSGSAQWQTRLRFGAPAAIVSSSDEGTIRVRVHADVGVAIPDVRTTLTTTSLRGPRVVARALGPHSVWIGWFPRLTTGVASIVRIGRGRRLALASVAAPSSSYRDDSVAEGGSYRYAISFANRPSVSVRADVPTRDVTGSIGAAFGKGAWLSFSPDTRDRDGYDKLDPDAIVARARSVGLRSIFLRTTYGPFREITAEDRPKIDALLDGAARSHVAVVAWTVPRSTAFDDFAAEIEAVEHRTPSGNGFSALAVDLERGDYFLGTGAAGYTALETYPHVLRAALGSRYPIVATVEDPYLEHLTNDDVPFAAIARDASVVQPMVYWRAVLRPGYDVTRVGQTIAASYAAIRRESASAITVNVGLQTSSQGGRGAPDPREIGTAMRSARRAGAMGATFFDWDGTAPDAWTAIARERW